MLSIGNSEISYIHPTLLQFECGTSNLPQHVVSALSLSVFLFSFEVSFLVLHSSYQYSVSAVGVDLSPRPVCVSLSVCVCVSRKCIVAKRPTGSGCHLGW